MEAKKISFDYLYRTTWQCIQKMYNEQAALQNSTMVIGFTLINIHYKDGTPSTALGPKMGIEATSLSRTLKKMEDLGFIYREKNPMDGRSVIVKLTELGKEKREQAKQTVLKFNEVVQLHLAPQQIDAFEEVSETIKHLIHERMIY